MDLIELLSEKTDSTETHEITLYANVSCFNGFSLWMYQVVKTATTSNKLSTVENSIA